MPPLKVALSLAGIVIIIIAAYYATWFISVKASGQSHGKLRNKNINLLDRFAISKDKSFCLVEIAGKVYVIGITNQTMTLLDTLDASELAETETERRAPVAWNIPGGGFTNRMTKRIAAFLAQKMGRQLENNEDRKSGATFASSLSDAHERSRSGRFDPMNAVRTGNTEKKE